MSSILDTFIAKAKDIADVATQKTGEMVEVSKYKIECVKINNQIEKLYQKMGSSVYSMIKGGYDNHELVEGLTEDIDEMLMHLEAVTEKINEMQKIAQCPACGAKNVKENFYCCKCGSRIKTEFDPEQQEDDCDCDCDCADCDNDDITQ